MAWSEIKKINSDFSMPLNETIGKKTDTANTSASATLFSWVKSISNVLNAVSGQTAQGGTSVIKSVQRGVSAGATNSNNISITISPINISKSVVSLYGFRGANTSGYLTPYVAGLSATSLSIGCSGNGASLAASFSWEIIEFY